MKDAVKDQRWSEQKELKLLGNYSRNCKLFNCIYNRKCVSHVIYVGGFKCFIHVTHIPILHVIYIFLLYVGGFKCFIHVNHVPILHV